MYKLSSPPLLPPSWWPGVKLDDDNVGEHDDNDDYYDVGEHDDDDDDGDNCDIMQLVQFYPTGVTDIVNGYPGFNYYDNLTINYWDMTYGPTGLLSLYCM